MDDVEKDRFIYLFNYLMSPAMELSLKVTIICYILKKIV
jgi:hypothetical protein